jgi:hypothetical protein
MIWETFEKIWLKISEASAGFGQPVQSKLVLYQCGLYIYVFFFFNSYNAEDWTLPLTHARPHTELPIYIYL